MHKWLLSVSSIATYIAIIYNYIPPIKMAHGGSMKGQQALTATRHANIPLAISFTLKFS